MKIKQLLFSVFFFTLMLSMSAQKTNKASVFKKPAYVKEMPSLASGKNLIPADETPKEIHEMIRGGNIVVPGKGLPVNGDPLVKNKNTLTSQTQGRAPILTFEAATSTSTPSDPTIAVGPNHVFVAYNTAFKVFDKSGNPLTAALDPQTVFGENACCDLVVQYDKQADRFLMMELDTSPKGLLLAVSQGPDPVNDGWYTFRYNFDRTPDYEKLSIWSDGYYITMNYYNSNTSGHEIFFALERDKILTGDNTAQMIGFQLPGIKNSGLYSPGCPTINGSTLPPAGNVPIIYQQDDAWAGVAQDHLKIWTATVDWATPANSTVTAAQELTTTPFKGDFSGGLFTNLIQPDGSRTCALKGVMMYATNYRRFGSYNSIVLNHVVDTDGNNHAGIRWYELRQNGDGQPWTIYQEGTFTTADADSAWCGSINMDVQGNIGLGYTIVGANHVPELRFTGRYAADPLGTMTLTEDIIVPGVGNEPSGYRYGDYAHMVMDPNDDKTFWYIGEYFNSGRKDQVGVYKIAPNFNNDVGVTNINTPATNTVLSADETVTVTIFNYGNNDASNFPVTYQLDGGAVISETYTGTLAATTSAQYTFTAHADFSTEGHTYAVVASTNMASDEDTSNDSKTKNITHISHNDIGVTAITSPVTGNNMGMETVTVDIQNFGGMPQSNFDVSYTMDNGTPVVEQVAGPLAPGATVSHSFAAQVDLSAFRSYSFTATTSLTGDADASNDSVSSTVVNSSCNTETNNTSQPIGPNSGTVTNSVINMPTGATITDVNVTINLNHTWDSDLDIFLVGPTGTRVELSTDNGSLGDNYIDTVFDDEATQPITDGSAPFTGSFQPEGNLSDFDGTDMQGDWTLEITDDANGDGGTLNSWSLEVCFDPSTSAIYENTTDASDMIVSDLGNKQFKISINNDKYGKALTFYVYDLLGQNLVEYMVINNGGVYSYDLDMSYMPAGVYVVKFGNKKFSKVKRILVK